ncbi:hypothetical protein MHYP_G00111930 [Metynnis hypsauchen]
MSPPLCFEHHTAACTDQLIYVPESHLPSSVAPKSRTSTTASLTEKNNLIPALLSLMATASSASMMMSGQKRAAKALMRTDEPQTSLFSSVRGKKASQAIGKMSAFVRLTAN